jgi:hypothetical protein
LRRLEHADGRLTGADQRARLFLRPLDVIDGDGSGLQRMLKGLH